MLTSKPSTDATRFQQAGSITWNNRILSRLTNFMAQSGIPSSPIVAFQGEPGAYSEAAALEHFGPLPRPCPCEFFDLVFAAVESGQVDCGLIAIENSLAGSIHHNYDLLLQHKLWITGEHYLRVRHCLITAPGVDLARSQKVISHPQALAQCDGYLRAHAAQAAGVL